MPRVNDLWTNKDRSRSSRYGRGSRWQAIWTDGKSERKKSFTTKAAAEDHLVWTRHKQRTGGYVSPSFGRMPVAELLPEWTATLVHLKASTRAAVESDIRATILPEWGHRILADITRSDIQAWVARMDKAPRTISTIHGRFRTFLAWCVAEGRIATNPATSVNLPRGRRREHQFLTVAQLLQLAESAGSSYGDLILFLATTGLRIGEAAELRVRDVNLARRRVTVARSVVFVRGRAMVDAPKSGKARTVPLTAAISAALVERIDGKGPDDLVFTTVRGQQIRANNFKRREFNLAVVSAREAGASMPSDLRVHDLRHTAASLAVASGASVKSVQRMLGHATAAVTLDVYAGLFDQELDDVASRMDAMLSDIVQ